MYASAELLWPLKVTHWRARFPFPSLMVRPALPTATPNLDGAWASLSANPGRFRLGPKPAAQSPACFRPINGACPTGFAATLFFFFCPSSLLLLTFDGPPPPLGFLTLRERFASLPWPFAFVHTQKQKTRCKKKKLNGKAAQRVVFLPFAVLCAICPKPASTCHQHQRSLVVARVARLPVA